MKRLSEVPPEAESSGLQPGFFLNRGLYCGGELTVQSKTVDLRAAIGTLFVGHAD